MGKVTVAQLRHILDTYDAGVLYVGAHNPKSGQYCALECKSLADAVARGDADVYANFTDQPQKLGMPDIRPLNDAWWSSEVTRTEAMLPLIAAYSDWQP